MSQQVPVIILREDTERTSGRDAQRNNIMAAIVIAETVKSALGPSGSDKMLIDGFGDITVTNDGATILKEIDIEHPAAKMVIEVAKTVDAEVGDGTTTAAILTGDLLKQAETLLDKKIHPTTIISGYRKATEKALKVIDEVAEKKKYEVIRSDQISEPGDITSQIIQHLFDDEIVVADLTDHNPNVFYELAVRHMLGKPVNKFAYPGGKCTERTRNTARLFYSKDYTTAWHRGSEFRTTISGFDSFGKFQRKVGGAYDWWYKGVLPLISR